MKLFQKNKSTQIIDQQSPLLVSTRVKILLTLLAGLVLSLLIVFIAKYQYIESMTNRVETISTLLDPERIESLKNQDTSVRRNEAYLKSQLQQAQGVNSDAALVYVMDITKTNVPYTLVDSSPDVIGNTTPLERQYDEATDMFKTAFYSGDTYVEGPVTDSRGARISFISPVYDGKGSQIAVVGMDVDPSAYIATLVLSLLVPIAAAGLISAMFLMTDSVRQRHQEGVRMRSELVSIASHELRTPLTGVRWGEEMLLKEGQPERSQQILQAMYDSTIRLQESIEDILQLANWQSGRNDKLVRTSINIDEMFQGIIATQKLPASQKGISLEFAKTWPKDLTINIDGQRMKRVFNNLMSNAIKYSKPNTSVVVGYEKVDGAHVISITDHGIGIPKKEQRKVFDGFYRATNAVSYEVGGTGMGLYMSRYAIEQHGGKLWLSSKEGEGTTAYIRIP